MIVQPYPLSDTVGAFQAVHSDMKEAYGAKERPNKIFTDIDFLIRKLYTECVLEDKNVLIVHDAQKETAVVVIDLEKDAVTVEVFSKDFDSESEAFAFHIAIGLVVIRKITEENCLWNDTSCKLGLALL